MRLNHGNTTVGWHDAIMRWLLLGVLLMMAATLSAQQGSIRSELSASTITLDESVTLSIIAIGVDGELDTSALEQDFDIVARSSSRQINTINGGSNRPTASSVTTWTLELMPRKVGIFTVPAVTVGGLSSELLSLTVNDVAASGRRDIFIEATVDTRTPWVQSQVLMSIRVFQGIEIVDGGLSDPTGQNLQVQRIGKDVYTDEERDGRRYSVTERRFALFPQKSGSLEIEPIVLSVSVPANNGQRGIFSTTRKLTRRTDSLTLEVQARPSSGAAWWLPASELTLTGDWAGSGKAGARVDQPLTRTVTMRGTGVLDSQLPDISIPAVEGVSLYAEEPVKSMVVNARGLQAEQIVKWALIPQREGELVLPEVSVEWFDTDTGKTEVAVLPEEIVRVGPAAPAGNAPPLASTPDSDDAQPITPGGGGLDSLSSVPGSTAARLPDSTTASIAPDSSMSGADDVAEAVRATDSAAMPGKGAPEAASSGVVMEALQARITRLQSASQQWKLLALLLLALWVASVVLFWWRKKRSVEREQVTGQRLGAIRKSANAAYQSLAPLAAVDAACAGSEPAAVRGALLEWAARQWPEQAPATLTALASRFDEGTTARELIQALDACLYSRQKDTSANKALLSRLRELPRHIADTAAGRKQAALSSLSLHKHDSSASGGRGLPEL